METVEKKLDFFTPDCGLEKGTALIGEYKNKNFIEIGGGNGRNSAYLTSLGLEGRLYELNPEMSTLIQEQKSQYDVDFSVIHKDGLGLDFSENTFDVVVLGLLPYLPKMKVRELLGRIEKWLKPNGILQLDVFTNRHLGLYTYFTKCVCTAEAEESLSFVAPLESKYNKHKFHGGSFWEEQKFQDMFFLLGNWKVIYEIIYEWPISEGEKDCIFGENVPKILLHSVFQGTYQKDKANLSL